jgi:glycolate oxidase
MIQSQHIDFFKNILTEKYVLTPEAENFNDFASDNTEDLVYYPSVVLLPRTPQEISQVLQFCNANSLPITARGAGTGLAGGALPTHGGIVLAMQRFNEILHIDEDNLQVTTEPGVVTELLQNAVKAKGLFYPPDPASKGSCFIGGNVAHNSGGPKAVKYGVVRDYVMNLEVVLASGEIIWTGANTLKNSTGFNLTQLMVGSEGTLGIITKIVLKLIPHPQFNLLLMTPFSSAENACAAVSAVFRAGIVPSGLEFIERNAMVWSLKYVSESPISIKDNEEAYLLIEVDGNNMDTLYADCERIAEVLEQYECGEILFADSAEQKEAIWRVRRSINPSIRSFTYKKELDIVVPRANLPKALKAMKTIGDHYGFETVCFGHAGDGNLHVNIIRANLSDDFWANEIPKATREMFQVVKDLGGLLSGEHGVGHVQRPYMDIMYPEVQLNLMRSIKKVFDPNGILNPNKIF